ncbi:sensor domain-containing protein [Methanolobus sp.]|uniref:sensor domain-containing protein n=1 Tax=Methanolobus sp. TaxID=1874737 RepID=UPI0025D82912|nr:sensor domain-containing protein [Methanolobus sp.]
MLEIINTAVGLAQKYAVDFVAVAFRRQTYMNMLYLLFTFPLGTAYFVFLVTGLSLGFHLVGIWIGIPILMLVLLAWWEMASFERQLAEWLLGMKMPPMSREQLEADSLFERWIVKLRNPVTWKALLFLFMKFPLGIFSLALAILMLAVTLFLLMSPLMYYAGYPSTPDMPWYTLEFSLVAFFAGIPAGLLSLHVMNFLAKLSGRFALLMLGISQKKEDSAMQEM